jgi:hypothetical protein
MIIIRFGGVGCRSSTPPLEASGFLFLASIVALGIAWGELIVSRTCFLATLRGQRFFSSGRVMEDEAKNLREQGIIHYQDGSVISGGGGRAEAARRISAGDPLEHNPGLASSCSCVIS